jgi:hypothetical protein
MLMTCANPDCSAPFDEGGRFFRFRIHPDSTVAAPNAHSVQHFWLCKACAGFYTLEYRKDNCVVIRPQLAASQAKAAARVIRADRL